MSNILYGDLGSEHMIFNESSVRENTVSVLYGCTKDYIAGFKAVGRGTLWYYICKYNARNAGYLSGAYEDGQVGNAAAEIFNKSFHSIEDFESQAKEGSITFKSDGTLVLEKNHIIMILHYLLNSFNDGEVVFVKIDNHYDKFTYIANVTDCFSKIYNVVPQCLHKYLSLAVNMDNGRNKIAKIAVAPIDFRNDKACKYFVDCSVNAKLDFEPEPIVKYWADIIVDGKEPDSKAEEIFSKAVIPRKLIGTDEYHVKCPYDYLYRVYLDPENRLFYSRLKNYYSQCINWSVLANYIPEPASGPKQSVFTPPKLPTVTAERNQNQNFAVSPNVPTMSAERNEAQNIAVPPKIPTMAVERNEARNIAVPPGIPETVGRPVQPPSFAVPAPTQPIQQKTELFANDIILNENISKPDTYDDFENNIEFANENEFQEQDYDDNFYININETETAVQNVAAEVEELSEEEQSYFQNPFTHTEIKIGEKIYSEPAKGKVISEIPTKGRSIALDINESESEQTFDDISSHSDLEDDRSIYEVVTEKKINSRSRASQNYKNICRCAKYFSDVYGYLNSINREKISINGLHWNIPDPENSSAKRTFFSDYYNNNDHRFDFHKLENKSYSEYLGLEQYLEAINTVNYKYRDEELCINKVNNFYIQEDLKSDELPLETFYKLCILTIILFFETPMDGKSRKIFFEETKELIESFGEELYKRKYNIILFHFMYITFNTLGIYHQAFGDKDAKFDESKQEELIKKYNIIEKIKWLKDNCEGRDRNQVYEETCNVLKYSDKRIQKANYKRTFNKLSKRLKV